MFVYAPQSNVTVSALPACTHGLLGTTCVGVGVLAGGFVGYNVTVSATVITQDLGLLSYPLSSSLGVWRVQQYIECTPKYPLPSPDPTSGC
jgi:hypothetical protein